MAIYTLSYSEQVQGWPSRYSFNPDFMIGMNNFFYTFKGGDLYRHNVNPDRNTFYLDWWTKVGTPLLAYEPSTLKSVINDAPTDNKLFKTISLIGDDAWAATLATDLQASGYIEEAWFEKKEASYFAYVRNSGTVPAGTDEYALRSVNGIGRSTTISGGATATNIDFATSVSIGSIVSIGDIVYFGLPPDFGSPVLFGKVTAITVDLPAGMNRLTVNVTVVSGTTPGIQNPYIMFIKAAVAESHGVLGHYMVFNITNDNKNKVELFTVESQVMKSYP